MSEASFELPSAEAVAQKTLLPHSIEAEQAVLGGLMLDNKRLDAVLEAISDVDFYREDHRQIFKMMQILQENAQPLDVITLSEELHRHDQLERVGGLAYLVEMANNTPSAANIVAYARIVRERSTLRQLIAAAQEISKSSYNPSGLDSDDLLQLAEKRVAEIAEDRPKEGGLVGVNDLLKATVQRIDELFRSGSDITGVPSGIADLDTRTSGWQPGELIILAARPSMGKTALALNFVESAMFSQNRPVLVFSMEMPSAAMVMRMMSSVGRIDQGRMRNGKLTEEDWPKLSSAVAKMKDKLLFIDDTPGLSPQELRARVRRIAREHGNPGMIMVDYLQLMQIAGSSEGRTQEISEISRSLKAIAKEFDCPLIALSQLNRGVEQRPNKRPMNSDLRESGAIEQDADVILFIYRDEYYNEDSPDKGIAELIIGKQRNGEIGTCRAAFIGKYTRFDNLAPEYFQNDGY
ncbi:replicative DNA helicase [Cellvibrio sp. PSBB006]|uniref:replicative DNA helicase n=1 Tax=Cellvibrio sp. PSBB006 TaxID=1987723 RepID=UPI000B3B0B7B|nr:replicative DNA helicase [Cellvibrio sp. PSBB006]ARU27740.1 replicative DNA helicase [Cellvibrio sp. PSBB006]